MSFVFPSWQTAFSPAFHEDAKAMLEGALNKGNKPPVIQGRIEVVELSMGTQPPTLTLLEIGDLSLDRFRGILRLGYQGDAWIEVRCRVQANPLSHNPNLMPSSTLPLSTPLLASQPLLVPMTLRLSKLHLRAILILVVSASKGITLVFKNDPLQNVDVSSTFDSVEVIRGYLQQEIEGQLREMFREDLPGIIHRLSQRWFTGTGVGGKVEMPYRDGVDNGGGGGAATGRYEDEVEEEDGVDDGIEKPLFPPHVGSAVSTAAATPPITTPNRRKQSQGAASAAQPRSKGNVSESPTSYTVFHDIEDYDPTYGLRPEGVPTHSGYEAFGRMWEKAREGGGRGLGTLMSLGKVGEEQEGGGGDDDRGDVSDGDFEQDRDAVNVADLDEVEDSMRSLGIRGSAGSGLAAVAAEGRSTRAGLADRQDTVEYESFPAVGGGYITRPRVFHQQSLIRAPSEAGGAMPSPSGTATGGSVTARASSIAPSSTVGSIRVSPFTPVHDRNRPSRRPSTSTGAGPSSLRRMVTSRSDVFLSGHAARPSNPLIALPTSASYASLRQPVEPFVSRSASANPKRRSLPPQQRRGSNSGTGTGTVTSGTYTNPRTRSTTHSTTGSSQLPSSRSMSHIQTPSTSPPRQMPISSGVGIGVGVRPRNASFASTSPAAFQRAGTGITLPINNSVSQLATLSHSAHTLSPYARAHEHIAVRSFPHLGRAGHQTPAGAMTPGLPGYGGGASHISATAFAASAAAAGDTAAVKARRKRIFKIGKKDDSPVPSADLTYNNNSRGGGRFSRDGSISSSPLSSPPAVTSEMRSNPDMYFGQQYRNRGSRGMSPSSLDAASARQWRSSSVVGLGSGATPSLTGMASKVMARPAYSRAPDSRTSYGFPAL